MRSIYTNLIKSADAGEKLLAVLIDPDKVNISTLPVFFNKLHKSITTHIFVGGSTDTHQKTHEVVTEIKKLTKLPVLLFPGDFSQVTEAVDGLLFLSLISGRNPEYLIEQHVRAIPKLRTTNIEVIPTGYILIDGGNETAVERVSQTKPMSQTNINLIVNTALAGMYTGKKIIYLEAGSGAKIPVNPSTIRAVKTVLEIPLIVGGGIRSKEQLVAAYRAGANMIVIGTAFENDENFFNEIKNENFS